MMNLSDIDQKILKDLDRLKDDMIKAAKNLGELHLADELMKLPEGDISLSMALLVAAEMAGDRGRYERIMAEWKRISEERRRRQAEAMDIEIRPDGTYRNHLLLVVAMKKPSSKNKLRRNFE